MPKNFSRTSRVADSTHRILARLLQTEFKDPRVGMITISGVEVSPDLRHAKVYLTVLPDEKTKETLKILNEASGFFRSKLASSLTLRVVPKLLFIFDESLYRGNRISAILNSQDNERSK